MNNNSASNINTLQLNVQNVVSIMNENMEKIIQRGENIEVLQEKSEQLESGSKLWKKNAKQLKKQYCWNNLKMMFILGLVGFIALILIIVSLTFYGLDNEDFDGDNKVENDTATI